MCGVRRAALWPYCVRTERSSFRLRGQHVRANPAQLTQASVCLGVQAHVYASEQQSYRMMRFAEATKVDARSQPASSAGQDTQALAGWAQKPLSHGRCMQRKVCWLEGNACRLRERMDQTHRAPHATEGCMKPMLQLALIFVSPVLYAVASTHPES